MQPSFSHTSPALRKHPNNHTKTRSSACGSRAAGKLPCRLFQKRQAETLHPHQPHAHRGGAPRTPPPPPDPGLTLTPAPRPAPRSPVTRSARPRGHHTPRSPGPQPGPRQPRAGPSGAACSSPPHLQLLGLALLQELLEAEGVLGHHRHRHLPRTARHGAPPPARTASPQAAAAP